jgi:heparosan-N-sulfate-glucuronate 5-epimerase
MTGSAEETPLHLMARGGLLPASLARAVNSALSRGPGYEPTPRGTAFDDHRVHGYYIDFSAKTIPRYTRNPSVLPATPLIQLALGWWERHISGDPAALPRFLALCTAIEARGERAGDQLLWPSGGLDAKYRLAARCPSALPQGQAASVFVRAHLVTREDRYGQLALAAVRPLLAPSGTELVTWTATGPILEEAPSNPPSHILNGWISGLWGVWDVQLGLGDTRAAEVFAASIRCLLAHLPAYDIGWWTLYSLFPHPLEDLAKPIYHRFHIAQLEVLHRLTGVQEFGTTARRWTSYDRPALCACAIAHKAAFTVVDGRRRRRWVAGRAGAQSANLPELTHDPSLTPQAVLPSR